MNWPNELKNISSYLRVNKETIYNSYIFVRWQELTQRFSSAYIQRQDVISAINAHAKQEGWVECSGGVGASLDNDPSPPSVTVSVGIIMILFRLGLCGLNLHEDYCFLADIAFT